MKILHTYCLNYNLGDYALGMGVKNLLRKYLDVDFIGNTNLQGQQFNEYYINEVVNKRYDLLVLGGGGVIHGAHWPNGWFWLIKQDLIKQIKIPFIIYGVGDNYFEDETIPQKAIDHLRETKKHAKFFSVRNDGSLERVVQQTGINAVEVPDPGFHVNLDDHFERPIKEPYVIIQVANDKADQRFDAQVKQRFIAAMQNVTRKLSKSYKVIFTPHVFDDVALSQEIADGIPNCEIWDFGYLAFDHAPQAVAYYKHAEFVLAMRGHGQILPIGFNVPTISMHNHPKHGGLMQKLGLEEYNVKVNDKNFAETLQQTLDNLQANRAELIDKYQRINAGLAQKSESAFAQIKQRLEQK